MRKHCTMMELLAVRDGEASAWAREHLTHCPHCQQELELVHQRAAQLRALPAWRPPRDRWAAVRARAQRERRSEVLRRGTWGALALAAGLALMVGVRSAMPNGAGSLPEPVARAGEAQLASLMDESRELEAALRSYGPEGRVLNARAAGIIADLEDRIALVDAGIAQVGRRGSRDDLTDLWRSRVYLMDALVNAHVTRASYVGF